jgi:hypothetical protein
MPFLLPAIIALTSDVFVVWLNSRQDPWGKEGEGGDSWVYHTGYTLWTAILRLLLLVIPLLFHSYTGTALRHLVVYRWFYRITAVLLICHCIALLLLNPESLKAIFVTTKHKTSTPSSQDDLFQLQRLWWILILSGLSIVCHWIVLLHVRSTAPSYDFSSQRKKKPTMYFALRAASLATLGNSSAARTDTNNSSSEPALMLAMNGRSKMRGSWHLFAYMLPVTLTLLLFIAHIFV